MLKIGVWMRDAYQVTTGGRFSYHNRLARFIDEHEFSPEIEIVFISSKPVNQGLGKKECIHLEPLSGQQILGLKLLKRIASWIPVFRYLARKYINLRISYLEYKHHINILVTHKVDLICYLTPMYLTSTARSKVLNYPFIATNWDIGHRSMHPFPEVAMNGAYQLREQYFREVLNKALLILTESETGKQELIRYFQYNPNRIKVFPMFPGGVVDLQMEDDKLDELLLENNLPCKDFFFYPAQFWSHKNHFNLLKGFCVFSEQLPKYSMVFTGSDKGNLQYIKNVVKDLGLEKKVHFGGFVSEELLHALYRRATALVMPTFLGPTNMPLLEATSLGCAVGCSDLPGHREMLEDNAVYFDPKDYQDITHKLLLLTKTKHQKTNTINILSKPDMKLLESYFLELIPFRKSFGYDW